MGEITRSIPSIRWSHVEDGTAVRRVMMGGRILVDGGRILTVEDGEGARDGRSRGGAAAGRGGADATQCGVHRND
jgi:hypothetical protein